MRFSDLMAQADPAAPALAAPGRAVACHGDLAALTRRLGLDLAALGLGRGDRVAIVLPNGPEMAAAFLCLAPWVTTAPLNPAYKAAEFDFYLGDLGARALIVARGSSSPAIEVARARGIAVLTLCPLDGQAGLFHLQAEPLPPRTATHDPDVALVLHTSGTTARPKIVPLTEAMLCASARHVARSLDLGPGDRCLNIMPLFHIHGLVAAVLASLGAGGSVFCTPGFDGLQFWSWLEEAEASWTTAVPTMYQALLPRAPRQAARIAAHPLRLLRASSAPLPARVMAELSATFGAPVIEAYGMTEAAHQMTSNPLSSGLQVAGSVGCEAGPKVRIADETEPRLTQGRGEVVIAGPNVFAGYEANPEANARAFFVDQGTRWFRTGDQGEIDASGYLRLTGRLKEIINRGGEKISPIEVDEVLMAHPAVAQAVTFARPHPTLGETVAAAVVLRDGEAASPQEIADFVAGRLAGFKCPDPVVILSEIPKGPTGKLQRIGLAARLGLALDGGQSGR